MNYRKMVPANHSRDRPNSVQEDSDDDLSFLDVGPSTAQYLQNKRPRTAQASSPGLVAAPNVRTVSYFFPFQKLFLHAIKKILEGYVLSFLFSDPEICRQSKKMQVELAGRAAELKLRRD